MCVCEREIESGRVRESLGLQGMRERRAQVAKKGGDVMVKH